MRVRAIAETVGDGSVKEYRIVQTVYALRERRVATQHTNNGGTDECEGALRAGLRTIQ